MLGRGFDGRVAAGLPAPSKAEALRMRLIAEGCCVACWRTAMVRSLCEVHHLTEGDRHGQLRLGHAWTVGLCCWHHRGEIDADLRILLGRGASRAVAAVLGPSYAVEPAAFRDRYGGISGLLQLQARELRRVHDSYLISPGAYACPLNS